MTNENYRTEMITFRMTAAEAARLQAVAAQSGGRSALLRRLIDDELARQGTPAADTSTRNKDNAQGIGV